MEQPLGLSHITFLVRDLERTARLFCEGLGATEIYDSGAQHFSRTPEKFFTLGGLWIDYDNHLLELHSGTLAERLASYRHLTPG